jgi:hypothetical protein
MTKVKEKIMDKDLANAEAALRRAAKRARTVAKQTHTPLVVYKKGQIIKKYIGKQKTHQQ